MKKPFLVHVAIWSAIAVLALLWSALAWPAHALSEWVAANSGALAGLPEWIARWAPSGWMAAWLPEATLASSKAVLAAAVPLLEGALALLPSLAAWLPAVVVAAWVAGLLLALLAGAACSVAVGLFAKRARA
ncbi:MAG: hypothetical protein AB7O31_06205 [Burkholderiales bacterium]